MSYRDALKVMVLLLVAVACTALLVHVRVDLGWSWDQINGRLAGWTDSMTSLVLLLWAQIALAAAMGLGYRIYRHRRERGAQ